ncbi:MAG: anaerobic ribonucleoside-triphosphate reductase activating protein [Fusobacteriaceae bacterium]
MNITGEINKGDMINGYGLRVSLFVSGCEHGCQECFSKHTWDKEQGYCLTTELKRKIINDCSSKRINGISILGGDPLASFNYKETVEFCREFKEKLPEKTIYVWTGFEHNHVLEKMPEIVDLAHVIITGKYEPENTSDRRRLLYRGSTNQTYIIDGEVFEDFPCGRG